MQDLPPKVLVFQHPYQRRRIGPSSDLVVYQNDRMRVMKMYEIGASPYQGQWVIRIDCYDS